jgi:hypothetical protein
MSARGRDEEVVAAVVSCVGPNGGRDGRISDAPPSVQEGKWDEVVVKYERPPTPHVDYTGPVFLFLQRRLHSSVIVCVSRQTHCCFCFPGARELHQAPVVTFPKRHQADGATTPQSGGF